MKRATRMLLAIKCCVEMSNKQQISVETSKLLYFVDEHETACYNYADHTLISRLKT